MVCGDLICDKGERTQSTNTKPPQILMIPQEVDFQMLFLNYVFKNTRLKDTAVLLYIYIYIK